MKRTASLSLALLLSACLGDAMVAKPRYFVPLPPPSWEREPMPVDASSSPLLRVRPVTAAAHLRERMVWRRAEAEYGFHELSRWTRPPADWAAQWLSRELFERRGLRRALAGAYPRLRVEVLAFDEILGPERAARVELAALLSDAHGVALLERVYAAQHPIERRGPVGVAHAMGAALTEAISNLGADTRDALSTLGP